MATLHHMNLVAALRKARSLLRPRGEIIVVGVAANRTPVDLPRDIGVTVAAPRESLREIRAVASAELPGARSRRGLYYRV